MSSLTVEKTNTYSVDEHVAFLSRIVHLYIEEVKGREDRGLLIKRLKRYCKMRDLSGLNNMLLNASSEEIKKMYGKFQREDDMKPEHLLDEFKAAINTSITDFN